MTRLNDDSTQIGARIADGELLDVHQLLVEDFRPDATLDQLNQSALVAVPTLLVVLDDIYSEAP